MKTKIIKQKSLLDYYGFTKTEQKKYPVITGILKQLTPERIEKEIKEIQKIKLPPELQKWVKEYEKVGERNGFIWKWVYQSSKEITFSTVSKKNQKFVWRSKVLIFMFDTLLDDIADKTQNKILLTKLLKIPFEQDYIKINHLNLKEKKYFLFTKKLWNHIDNIIKIYPRYKKFKDIFEYDIIQLLNTMKYSYLINRNPYLINKTESWIYFSHNMCGIICGTIDLMNTYSFNILKLKAIRKIFWEAQQMARIGNWVTTWERELKDADFTSGVLSYVIDSNVITINELKKGDELEIMKKIKDSKSEEKLLKKWEEHYYKIKEIGEKERINVKKFLSGLEKFIILHLISKGYK